MDQEERFVEQLFISYHEALKYYCMRCFSYRSCFLSHVDDCIQEVFFAALKKKDKLISHPNPYAWLRNACKKQCMMVIRRDKLWQKAVERIGAEDAIGSVPCIEDDILRWIYIVDAGQRIEDIKKTLTESEKTVFVAYFEQRKSAADIAKSNGTSVSSVRGAIQRIRKKALHFELLLFVVGQFSLLLLCSI